MSYHRFGAYLLDEEQHLLTKNSQVITLEPKTMELLIILVKNKHRVLSKEELLTSIWQGRAVVDNVLTRCIYELRKLLNDKNSDLDHIRTVRGVGYQFAVAVKHTVTKTNTVKSPETTKPSAETPKYYYLIAISLLCIGLITSYLLNNHNSHAKAQVRVKPTIGILPITTQSPSAEINILSLAISDYLTNKLSNEYALNVIPPEGFPFYTGMEADLAIAEASQPFDYLLRGKLKPSVNQEVIELDLTLYTYSPQQSQASFNLGSFSIAKPTSSENLLAMYKERSLIVKEILQLVRPGIEINHQDQAGTQNPDAYRFVISALQLFKEESCQHSDKIEQLLKQAISLDENFAYAWRLLYSNQYRRVWLCKANASYYEDALTAANITDTLAPNEYGALLTGRAEILTETNRAEQAFSLITEKQSKDIFSLNASVYVLRFTGFYQQAEALMAEILAQSPLNYLGKPIMHSPNVYFYQNKYQAYLAQLPETDYLYHDFYRALTFYFSDDIPAAKSILQQAMTKSDSNIYYQYCQALLLIIEAKENKAIEIIEKIHQERIARGNKDGEKTYKEAQLMALANNTKLAIDYLNKAIEQGFYGYSYIKIDPAFTSLHDKQTFTLALAYAKQRHLEFADKFSLSPELDSLKLANSH